MQLINIIILNIICYIFFLIVVFRTVGPRYKFPFRYADLINLIICTLFFSLLTFIKFGFELLMLTIFLNINLFYIFFHIINMITTSPRTRIVLNLYNSKNNSINLNQYSKKYNNQIILNNRINRLLNNNQIFIKNRKIFLEKRINYLNIISFFFKLIKNI